MVHNELVGLEPLVKRLSILVVAASLFATPLPPQSPAATPPQKTIVVGFVGGIVSRNDLRRNEVLLSDRLYKDFPAVVATQVFENTRVGEAHHFILGELGKRKHTPLSLTQKQNARIVLYGHSWGAAAVVALSRRLKKEGIPVLLTVQVDSIHRLAKNDSVIPSNVREAVNFFQPNGILHGRRKIRAADPARTKILGNFEMDYSERHVDCKDYPWYEKTFTKTHSEIECDPLVWNQIDKLIHSRISAPQ